jgi:hypothetical protein
LTWSAISSAISSALPLASLMALFALGGCGPKVEDDSGPVVDTSPVDDTEEFSCPTPEMRVNGEDPPSVGDYWEVFLWCGNTLMTGAMHMSIDPPSLATIDDYHMTYNEAGSGVLSVQVGSLRDERAVEVAE